MRTERIWRIRTVALAALLLGGLLLPHHHEDHEDHCGHADHGDHEDHGDHGDHEDHGGKAHETCLVCELQKAIGTSWTAPSAPATADLTEDGFPQPAPVTLVLPLRLSPHAPRGPPLA